MTELVPRKTNNGGYFCNGHTAQRACHYCGKKPTVRCMLVSNNLGHAPGFHGDRIALCQEHYDYWKVAAPLSELVIGDD